MGQGRKSLLAGGLIVLGMVSCGATVATGPQRPTASDIALVQITTKEKPGMIGVPLSPDLDPALQKMVTQAKEDLAGRLGVNPDQINLVEVQSVVWPDKSLGCPRPGMVYAQVQVDGLLIRFNSAGRLYEYHSGGSRPPFLCENPTGTSPGLKKQ